MAEYEEKPLPTIGEDQLNLLEKLCNACGVSGFEKEIRIIIRDQIKSIADSWQIDALGNVIAIKKAQCENFTRVLIAAHMDEVGFVIVNKEDDGIFQFKVAGGIDPRALAGKSVQVGEKHLPGVIGACPVHLTSAEDRKRTIPITELRIDTGIGTKNIEKGEFAAFATKFMRMGSDSICAKAIDNRIGVATLIELFKSCPENVELIAAFTVQEEVGLRGARVVAWDRNPDMAFILDSTPANDLPDYLGRENTQYKSKLGLGPAIYAADGRTLSDPRLIRYLLRISARYRIPCQIRQPLPGGTDAGAIHLTQNGIPSISVSVPGRYAHTAASIARISDWENHLRLLTAALRNIRRDIIEDTR